METIRTQIKLSCGHTYCKKCISLWMIQKPNCPYCRTKLIQDDVQNLVLFGVSNNYINTTTLVHINVSHLSDSELHQILGELTLDFNSNNASIFLSKHSWNHLKTLIHDEVGDLLNKLQVSEERLFVPNPEQKDLRLRHVFKFI